MNNLQVINEQVVLGKEFKVYGTFEEPLFLAKDVAEWIDYSVANVNKMLDKVDEDEKTTHTISMNGNYTTNAWFLTEDGLYEVLMQSRKPIAKQFKKKVKEILKALRKGEAQLVSAKDRAMLNIMNATNDVERAVAINEFQQIVTIPLLEQIEQDKPKIDIYNRFLSSEGSYTSTQVAKLFKISSARKFNKLIKDNNVAYKQGKNWIPYATTDDTWYKIIINDYGTQLRWTPKGILEIAELLGIEISEEQIEELIVE